MDEAPTQWAAGHSQHCEGGDPGKDPPWVHCTRQKPPEGGEVRAGQHVCEAAAVLQSTGTNVVWEQEEQLKVVGDPGLCHSPPLISSVV